MVEVGAGGRREMHGIDRIIDPRPHQHLTVSADFERLDQRLAFQPHHGLQLGHELDHMGLHLAKDRLERQGFDRLGQGQTRQVDGREAAHTVTSSIWIRRPSGRYSASIDRVTCPAPSPWSILSATTRSTRRRGSQARSAVTVAA